MKKRAQSLFSLRFPRHEPTGTELCDRFTKHLAKLRRGNFSDTLLLLNKHLWLGRIKDWPSLSKPEVKAGVMKCVEHDDFDTVELALKLAKQPFRMSVLECSLVNFFEAPIKGAPPFRDWPDQALADFWDMSLDQIRKTRQRLKLSKTQRSGRFQNFIIRKDGKSTYVSFNERVDP